jgi:uncharacterized membrane protein YoaK (UPF0700 family)
MVEARHGAALSERVVARLLVGLAAAAGCLDAVCMTRLGGVFASVITGNLVQLGRGLPRSILGWRQVRPRRWACAARKFGSVAVTCGFVRGSATG